MKKYNALYCLLYLTLFAAPLALADGYSTDSNSQTYYSSQPPTNMPGGYSSQPITPPAPPSPPRHEHRSKEKFGISINLSDTPAPIITREVRHVVVRKPHYADELEWVTIDRGDGLPRHIVTGGYQSNPPATLYVCRAGYRGGVHPGKVFGNACNFGWGGNEIVETSRYEVLTSRRPLRWIPASYGTIPAGAIEGGYQHDGPLYICQARYRGGMHPGKLYGDNCLIGWGGQEVGIPEYYVLTK